MESNEPTKKKRGGPQPGSGRPPKDPKDTVVKCKISMTQEHHAATEGDRSGIIRRALDVLANIRDREAFCLWYYAQTQPLSADGIIEFFNHSKK